MGNLSSGTGRISDDEAAQLKLIKRNSVKLVRMGKRSSPKERRGGKRNESEVNRQLRNWVNKGKSKGTSVDDWKNSQAGYFDAFDALDYFDIDPDEKTYYVDRE